MMKFGSKQSQTPQSTPQPANLRGFSPRINDPAFGKYIKNTNRWSAIFSIILAVGAVAGFYIAGEVGSEMDNPESLYIGFGIGGMFLLIALFQILGRNRSKTWDGTVEDKKIKKKTERQTFGDDDVRYEDYLEYSVIIRSDQGKRYTIRSRDNDTLYNYYRIGDRIRHHAGLKSYEKHDKSGDRFIPCNACGTLCDISDDYCFRCKCPLLK
ncbi:hypothetical protein [Phosphitispora fastidiosa]|uniref:hypothetical protein n=1 Tax=Phosphitispora fastidiosa TaxID=2837202 RepID=UPI001E3D564E|nr:hypothetical protein [Phosphitispora fastidiosa]MBU7006565.1 hypothetical protein [Phosphitispora fastidiosa]